jgi:hypothetical protein
LLIEGQAGVIDSIEEVLDERMSSLEFEIEDCKSRREPKKREPAPFDAELASSVDFSPLLLLIKDS